MDKISKRTIRFGDIYNKAAAMINTVHDMRYDQRHVFLPKEIDFPEEEFDQRRNMMCYMIEVMVQYQTGLSMSELDKILREEIRGERVNH